MLKVAGRQNYTSAVILLDSLFRDQSMTNGDLTLSAEASEVNEEKRILTCFVPTMDLLDMNMSFI